MTALDVTRINIYAPYKVGAQRVRPTVRSSACSNRTDI